MIQNFLKELLTRKWPNFKVAHHAILPHSQPRHGQLAAPLPPPLEEALTQQGITRLYSHQAAAIDQIRKGNHVVVATPTSSGKSLIYNLAVVESLIRKGPQHALYLFPIKALSRDQLQNLSAFLNLVESSDSRCRFRADTYDGDTTPHFRSKIRQNPPHILLSNPDMLHYALLPFHSKWQNFWENLQWVVLDEMHTYRGVFGSHVGQILRRLLRICHHYGSRPQFTFLSATIANPGQLAGQLLGVEAEAVRLVDSPGAPQPRRHFVFMETEEGSFGQPSGLAARFIARAAQMGLKTIAFTQSRKLTELVHMDVLRASPALKKRVSSYRAGFMPEERRSIEQRLSGGELDAVISTSALEAGIDIGGLDLCILVGYPGTVMTTWQRGGRVGRSGQESAIILIPQADALDHYISQHPEQFLSTHYEVAIINPLNEEILKAHLPCSAAELPIGRGELSRQEDAARKVLRKLLVEGRLLETVDGTEILSARQTPHRNVDIRSVGESYTIVKKSPDSPQQVPLGKSEGIRALKECHPGAVYLHRGETYHVDSLDLLKRVITVSPSQAPYYTRVKSEKETEILEYLASKPVANFVVRMGRLRVTEYILSYEKRRLFSQELLGTNTLELPPQTFETVGFWVEIEPSVQKSVQASKLHFMGGIHAVEHALISVFPLFALCDRGDIGGISIPMHPQLQKGAVFIYDGYPGGIGLAARGFEIIEELLQKTKELIRSCGCEWGCPACIHSPKCGSGNKPLDKEASLAVLHYLLGDRALPQWHRNPSGQEDPLPSQDTAPPPSESYHIGFLDLETQRLAQEVGGWHNKHLMRVSVAVLYESLTDSYRVYGEKDVPTLVEDLQKLDLVVGFNISQFDYAVLKAYTPFDLHSLPTLDLLAEIRKSLGFRLSLEHLAQKTLGRPKSSDGIQAVNWFRQGRWDLLVDYCTLDVNLTRDLFHHALEKGFLVYSDRRDRLLRIPTPWDPGCIIEKHRNVSASTKERPVRTKPFDSKSPPP